MSHRGPVIVEELTIYLVQLSIGILSRGAADLRHSLNAYDSLESEISRIEGRHLVCRGPANQSVSCRQTVRRGSTYWP